MPNEITSSQQEKQEGQEKQETETKNDNLKTPKDVPYYRVQELSKKNKDLENSLNELKDSYNEILPYAQNYQDFVSALETPAFRRIKEEIEKIQNGDFPQEPEKEENFFEEKDKSLEALEKKIEFLEQQQLSEQWDREIAEIAVIAQKFGIDISEKEIYSTMQQNQIGSPKIAGQLILGTKIPELLSKMKEKTELEVRQEMEKNRQKEKMPIKESSIRLVTPSAKTLDEASQRAIDYFQQKF